jgi:DNA-3-methyladenine glycosylase
MKLPQSFYQRSNVVQVAKELIGKILVTSVNDVLTSGMIVETEAYSFKERGCHAYKGQTERNKVMFEKGGISYVYLCYGMHHLFNVVTNQPGKADAVLIRALEPVQGMDLMMERMNVNMIKRITSGPGKLTKALGITKRWNGVDLVGEQVWIEEGEKVAASKIKADARIGIDYAGEDALLPWRFSIKDNKWVSK